MHSQAICFIELLFLLFSNFPKTQQIMLQKIIHCYKMHHKAEIYFTTAMKKQTTPYCFKKKNKFLKFVLETANSYSPSIYLFLHNYSCHCSFNENASRQSSRRCLRFTTVLEADSKWSRALRLIPGRVRFISFNSPL